MLIIPLIEALIEGLRNLKKIDPVEIVLDCAMMIVGGAILVVLVSNS